MNSFDAGSQKVNLKNIFKGEERSIALAIEPFPPQIVYI